MEEIIIKCIKTVYDTLGYGLSETIYQKALVLELNEHFKTVETEKSLSITYKNHEIAVLRADIVIDNSYILELKATSNKLGNKEEYQLKRYMKILNLSKGILTNFGKELEFKVYN